MKTKLLSLVVLLYCAANLMGQEVIKETSAWRPTYHFTPPKNWTNDPNGLLFINNTYPLYYQHNPFENKWGHMSWGHAPTKDLLHWEHQPVAIPEEITPGENGKDTTWIFSGSAVYDKSNRSGFSKDSGCVVAIYTANQPNKKKESQFIAYSNDGGRSFEQYKGNPVIDLSKRDFRDPNVFWYEKDQKWIMSVSLPAEYKIQFYESRNLKDWKLLSEFGHQGYTVHNWECPSLLRLPVENEPGQYRWVLFVSSGGPMAAAFMQYFVGDFNGKKFTCTDNPNSYQTFDYGDAFYAAIPWNGLKSGKNLFIGWMVPGIQETSPWKGHMSIPRNLSLRKKGTYYEILQTPATEISSLLARQAKNSKFESRETIKVDKEEILLNKITSIKSLAYWLEVSVNIETAERFGFTLGRKKDSGGKIAEEYKIIYDKAKNQLLVDRSLTGEVRIADNRKRMVANVQPENGKLKFVILVDHSSLEIFLNKGEKVISTLIYPDAAATDLIFFAEGGSVTLSGLRQWDLSKI